MEKNINTKVVISELHRAFKLFNENFFEGKLPEPAILIQSRGNKKLTLGWCTVKKVWKNEATKDEKYEINLVAEGLNRGIYPVMTTLLHEMVHLHNLVNNIKDTSRGGTYHNMKFKKTAEAHGLISSHADKIGWSPCKLQGLTMDLIDMAEFDEAVFSFGRLDLDFEGAGKPRKKKKTSSRKYYCPECGTSIRASKDVNVLCGDCTKVEEGKTVLMIKELDEDDIEGNDFEGFDDGESWGKGGESDSPEDDKIELTCPDCGCISNVDAGETMCPECGFDTAEEPEEITPAGIVEVDTELNDGAGNMIPVKQGMIDVDAEAEQPEPTEEEQEAFAKAWEDKDNTGWEEARIEVVLKQASHMFLSAGMHPAPLDKVGIEISDKMKSQWALYKEGKKFTFSKNYLETATDEEVEDTIKHQYIHHYQFITEGLKVNHKKDFKALCEKFGIKTDVPVKNHRAMK